MCLVNALLVPGYCMLCDQGAGKMMAAVASSETVQTVFVAGTAIVSPQLRRGIAAVEQNITPLAVLHKLRHRKSATSPAGFSRSRIIGDKIALPQ